MNAGVVSCGIVVPVVVPFPSCPPPSSMRRSQRARFRHDFGTELSAADEGQAQERNYVEPPETTEEQHQDGTTIFLGMVSPI